jgi:hypothetical protein
MARHLQMKSDSVIDSSLRHLQDVCFRPWDAYTAISRDVRLDFSAAAMERRAVPLLSVAAGTWEGQSATICPLRALRHGDSRRHVFRHARYYIAFTWRGDLVSQSLIQIEDCQDPCPLRTVEAF